MARRLDSHLSSTAARAARRFGVAAWLALLLWPAGASAQVSAFYDDPAGFNTAAGSPPVLVSFDDIAAGTNISGTTRAGIAFTAPAGDPSGSPLIVVAGSGTSTPPDQFSGTTNPSANKLFATSAPNVLSPGGAVLGADPAVQGDHLQMTFAAPVSAVALDVLFQSEDGLCIASVFISSETGPLHNSSIPCGSMPGGAGGSTFAGFVSPQPDIKTVLVVDQDNDSAFPDGNLGYDSVRASGSGRLEVRKRLEPATDPGRFNLQIDGATQASGAGSGATTAERTVAAGTHTVGETGAGVTSLAQYSKSITCRNANGAGSVVAQTSGDSGGPLPVLVGIAEDVVCTVANVRRPAIALPPPVLGRSANVFPLSGRVYVSVPPGTARAARSRAAPAQVRTVPGIKGRKFVPLRQARNVPIGSLLDTRKGKVRITTAIDATGKGFQSGEFSAGVFQVLQSRRARAKGLTELRLKGGNRRVCGHGSKLARALAATHRKKRINRVRGNARRRWRTSTGQASATIRSTIWQTIQRCDGTLIRVSRGRVAVRDFRRKKTIVVKAGKRYLARARAKRRR